MGDNKIIPLPTTAEDVTSQGGPIVTSGDRSQYGRGITQTSASTGPTVDTSGSSSSGGFESPMDWSNELISQDDFDAVSGGGRLAVGSAPGPEDPDAPRGVTPETAKSLNQGTRTQFETKTGTTGEIISIDYDTVGRAAGLTLNDLCVLASSLTGTNYNLLSAWVYLLLNGAAAAGKTIQSSVNRNLKDQPVSIEGNMLMYMWYRGNAITKGYYNPTLQAIFKKTPAYKNKFFEDIGAIGNTLVSSTDNLPNNPMTGSEKQVPSLLEQALNKIHPKFTEELEKYINVLKGKAYLALPAGVLGSIQYAINYITGVVAYIAQMINEIYQGALKLVKEFVAALDSIAGVIMQWLLTLLDRIIPLEIICFILDIISIFAGDLTMFTQWFSSSLKISDILEEFGIAPEITEFLSDPVGSLTSYLPEEVQNIMNIVNSVGNDPLGYLGSVLSEYGYTYMAYYLKGDVMGGLLNQFGSQAPVLYPLAAVFRKYGITGQVQLFDPNSPSRNVVMPEFLTEFRGNVQRSLDNMGRDLVKGKNYINEGVYNVAKTLAGSPSDFGTPTNNFGLDSNTTGT
jgi:hypothetical protein